MVMLFEHAPDFRRSQKGDEQGNNRRADQCAWIGTQDRAKQATPSSPGGSQFASVTKTADQPSRRMLVCASGFRRQMEFSGGDGSSSARKDNPIMGVPNPARTITPIR
jgi:hypothetical protein